MTCLSQRFGYMANTRTKFIIVTETNSAQLQDSELRIVCCADCKNLGNVNAKKSVSFEDVQKIAF
jgi:hypothetical protein